MILSDEEFMGKPTTTDQAPAAPTEQPVSEQAEPSSKRLMTDEEFMGQLTPESQKKVQEFRSQGEQGRAMLRGAAQGFTLGYEPELLGGQLYQQLASPNPAWAFGKGSPPDVAKIPQQAAEITEAEKKANLAAQEAHPVTYGIGNVIGSGVNPVLSAVKPGITSGAVIGGVSGASEGETPAQKLKGTAEGSVAGGVLGGVMKNFVNPNQAEVDRIIKEARDIGIDIPRYMASPNIGMQSTANILKTLPIAGTPIEQAARKTIQQMGTAADNLGGVDPEYAGKIFSDSIKKWVTDTSKKTVGSAYDEVSKIMDPRITTPLDNTANMIAELAAKGQESAIPGKNGAINLVLGAVQRPDGLNYNGLKNLRTFIGEKLDNPSVLPSDISGSDLKRIYGALTEDLNAAAKNAGNDAGVAAHKAANDLASQVAEKRESLVSLLGGPGAGASNENVFGNIIAAASKSPGSADMELLKQAKAIVPPAEWQKAASGAIAQMGRDADGNFSPTRFLGPNGYNKLSDAGKDALFGAPGTSTRDNLETIADVSRQFGNYMKYGNASGSGHAIIGAETLKEAAKHPIDILATLFGGRKLAEQISNPSTSSAIADWSRAYLKAMPTSPIGSTLGLAKEGAIQGSLGFLKAATRNLATVNAKATGENVAALTRGLWKPTADSLGLTGDNADINRNTGGRTTRATGGPVNLMALSKTAKKKVTQSTKDLLNEDDTTVARALEVANQNI